MISIDIDNNDTHLYMHVEGHSDYGEHGQDIVCASVSVLAQSFLLFALELQEDELVHVSKMVVESGYIDLEMEGHGYSGALRMMVLGLKEIKDKYPNQVKCNFAGE